MRGNSESFAKAYWARSVHIEGGAPELVSRLVELVSSAEDHGDIDQELERAGFTNLALKVFDESMEAL